MPSDGGVDVTSGACAPKKPPPKKTEQGKTQTKPNAILTKKVADVPPDPFENCAAERTLVIEPGGCSWFLIKVRGKRISIKGRKALEKDLLKLVTKHYKNIPTHTEPHDM